MTSKTGLTCAFVLLLVQWKSRACSQRKPGLWLDEKALDGDAIRRATFLFAFLTERNWSNKYTPQIVVHKIHSSSSMEFFNLCF